MARIRYLHPDFFVDDDLAKLPFAVRIFFAGMWCQADKEGRLEYKPDRLKVLILPYDKINPVKYIDMLTSSKSGSGYICVYEIDSKRYIQILNWKRYQKPHHTERESTIPCYNGSLTVKQPLLNTLKEKEKEEEKEKGKEPKRTHLDFVRLTEAEYSKLIHEYGDFYTQKYIKALNGHIGSKGDKYKSHYYTILNWLNRDDVKKIHTKQPMTAEKYRKQMEGEPWVK